MLKRLLLVVLTALPAMAQSARNVLVVVNQRSAVSKRIAQYYTHRREIPTGNVCTIDTPEKEEIDRKTYESVERQVAACLRPRDLHERILYIAMTMGTPLRVMARSGKDFETDASSVDSELALLYARMKGVTIAIAGAVDNPFFGHRDAPFRHPNFPIYLVTRLAGYDFEDVQNLIDHSLAARNSGKWVVDLRGDNKDRGNDWLRETAALLPHDRLILEETGKVLYDQKDVLGYASWGSNDLDRHRRLLGFQWTPGAIATELVSTNGRTFTRPPASWTLGSWNSPAGWFMGSPQDLSADFVHEGVTGVSGQVYEPYLNFCPRPNLIIPAYASGRNLAESFYLGLTALSWQNIVIGDPLCKLRQ